MRDFTHLGKYIRDCRVRSGLTQADISKKLGYTSSQFVSNWERGVSMPPMKTIAVLSRMIKLDPKHVVEIYVDGTRNLLERQFKIKSRSR